MRYKLTELLCILPNKVKRLTSFIEDDMNENALKEIHEIQDLLNKIEELVKNRNE